MAVDSDEAKLATARGVLDELHQWLLTRAKKAEGESAANAAALAAMTVKYDALSKTHNELLVTLRAAVGPNGPVAGLVAPPA